MSIEVQVNVKCSDEERERWALAARLEDRTRLQWIRRALNLEASRVISEAEHRKEVLSGSG